MHDLYLKACLLVAILLFFSPRPHQHAPRHPPVAIMSALGVGRCAERCGAML
jgi:hypothetical protein